MLRLLDNEDPELRGAALTALQQIGIPEAEDFGLLVQLLKDKSASLEGRIYAASVLHEVGSAVPSAVSLLVGALQDTNRPVRQAAARSLA